MKTPDAETDAVADLAAELEAAGLSDPHAAAVSLLDLLAMLTPPPPSAVARGSRKQQPDRAVRWRGR